MSKTVIGLFEGLRAAGNTALELEALGFGAADISLLMSDGSRGHEWIVEDHSKAPEGAAAGAATGGIVGALIAGLTAVGTITTGGAGIIAAGPVVAALAGAGAGGGLGGAIGALIGGQIPEHEVEMIQGGIERGKVVLGVRAHDDQVDLVEQLVERNGALSVKSTR